MAKDVMYVSYDISKQKAMSNAQRRRVSFSLRSIFNFGEPVTSGRSRPETVGGRHGGNDGGVEAEMPHQLHAEARA